MTILTRTPAQTIQQGIRRNTFNAPRERPKNNEELMERFVALEESTSRALGENFRDADDAQRVITVRYPRELVAVYALPLYLALPAEPRVGIVLVRVRKVPDDEQPIPGVGSHVQFVWDGVQSRARITAIEGLTPGTQRYRFNFEVIG